MSAAAGSPGGSGAATDVDDRRRWLAPAFLVLLLLLVAGSCAYGVARLTGSVGATAEGDGDGASPTGSPTPVPTVTVTVPVTAPSTGGAPVVAMGMSAGDGDGVGAGGVGGTGEGTVDGGASRDFTMQSTLVDGPLLLGQPRTLRVTISNPNDAAISVQSLRVRVGTPSATGCAPAWLEVGDYDSASDPALSVAARGMRSVDLDAELVNLPSTNQNACKGASFPLTLSGSAIT